MQIQNHAARAAALALVAAGLSLGGAAPAAAQANTPACVDSDTWTSGVWNYAKATNWCGSSKRFYFRWDRAVDGDCTTLANGYQRTEGRLYQARFAGFTDC